jgi:hypothetical protein
VFAAPAVLMVSAAISGFFVTQQEIEETSSYVEEVFFARIVVDYFPESMLPPDASELDLIPVRSADVTELLAAAAVPGGWIVMDTLVSNGQFNEAKSWAWWDDEKGQLALASQMPFRMFTFITVWQPAGQGFELVDEYQEDPSEEALADTEALLDSGLVEEASQRLFDVFYPGWYYSSEEMAAKFLHASWNEAERRAEQGDWEGALGIYFAAGEAYGQCVLDDRWFLDAGKLRAEGNPIELYLCSDTLLTILGHIEMVADGAGDTETSAMASAAAESLSVWMDL